MILQTRAHRSSLKKWVFYYFGVPKIKRLKGYFSITDNEENIILELFIGHNSTALNVIIEG